MIQIINLQKIHNGNTVLDIDEIQIEAGEIVRWGIKAGDKAGSVLKMKCGKRYVRLWTTLVCNKTTA